MNQDRECEICRDITTTYHVCACGNTICNACFNQEFYEYNEWIIINTKCCVCSKCICSECVNFCYNCMNEDSADWYCDDCCPKAITVVDCPYHYWSTCDKKHECADGCGACSANRNYSAKHEI